MGGAVWLNPAAMGIVLSSALIPHRTPRAATGSFAPGGAGTCLGGYAEPRSPEARGRTYVAGLSRGVNRLGSGRGYGHGHVCAETAGAVRMCARV